MSHTQFNKDRIIELVALLRVGKNYSECTKWFGMNRSSVRNETKTYKIFTETMVSTGTESFL